MAPEADPMMTQANLSTMPPIHPPIRDIEGMSDTRGVGPHEMVVPPAPLMPPPMTFQLCDELDLNPN